MVVWGATSHLAAVNPSLMNSMNGAELHLVINHAPALFTIAALLLAVWGLATRDRGIQSAGMFFLILAGVVSWMSLATGEGAEEVVERFGVDHHLIHEHEEMAEKSFYLAVAAALLAAFSWWRLRVDVQRARMLVMLSAVGALVSVGLTGYAAALGGLITHKEIRADAEASGVSTEHSEADEQAEHHEHEEGPETPEHIEQEER